MSNQKVKTRYQILDKCFSLKKKRYTLQQLLIICNQKGESKINIRQLRKDIAQMKSNGAPIVTPVRKENFVYYYTATDYCYMNAIKKDLIPGLESMIQEMLKMDGLHILSYLKTKLDGLSGVHKNNETFKAVVSFERNHNYIIDEIFETILSAIFQKQVLRFTYTPFGKKSGTRTFHPSFLKEYNRRWFAFGYCDEEKNYATNFPLDRIDQSSLSIMKKRYKENPTDWDEYFEDIIGVTKNKESKKEDIHLVFTEARGYYIDSKPLHPMQSNPKHTTRGWEVKLKLCINKELESLLLSFGNDVEIIQPLKLRQSIFTLHKKACE